MAALKAGIGRSRGTGRFYSDWSLDKLLGVPVPIKVEEQAPIAKAPGSPQSNESISPERHHPAVTVHSMCSESKETWEEYQTQLSFPLLAAVSTKMSTEIDAFAVKHQIDQYASDLLKQINDEQAQDIMGRAFAPRVRNPSADITRAAKSKLREDTLKNWDWKGEGNDSEWWGSTNEIAPEEEKLEEEGKGGPEEEGKGKEPEEEGKGEEEEKDEEPEDEWAAEGGSDPEYDEQW